jgi:hypothetical protein
MVIGEHGVDAFYGLADSDETGGVSIGRMDDDVRSEELWDEVGLVLVKALLIKAVNDDGRVGGSDGHGNSFGLSTDESWKKRKGEESCCENERRRAFHVCPLIEYRNIYQIDVYTFEKVTKDFEEDVEDGKGLTSRGKASRKTRLRIAGPTEAGR